MSMFAWLKPLTPEDENEFFKDVMGYFNVMAACTRDAAAKGNAMMLNIS